MIPALLTSTSRRPKCSSMDSAQRSTLAWSVVSSWRGCRSPSSVSAAARTRASSRPPMTTAIPSAARRREISSPIPRFAPLTSATCAMFQTLHIIRLGSLSMPVEWTDEIDGILGGDLTAGLAYVTPAGGAVVAAVAPVGLRDREAGTVSFTTSFGCARTLTEPRHNPRVALAFHAREHGADGASASPRYVLVQGGATVRDRDER